MAGKTEIIQWLLERFKEIEAKKESLTTGRFNREFKPRLRELSCLIDNCVKADRFHENGALPLADVGGMLPEEKNKIDLAYLTGVFNVSGMDGLSKEIDRLKRLGIKPHEIFS